VLFRNNKSYPFIGIKSTEFRKHLTRKHSAVLQMRDRGLRAIVVLSGQADDKADAMLLNAYQ
jgi:hypothetical protein